MTRPVEEPTTSPTTYPRLLHVDNLRTALTVLVVIHHAALGYSNVPGWYYVEPSTDSSATLLDVLLVLNQAFFMGAFFLISALFVPGSYDRKGPRRFVGERLLRLGVPLVLWLLVLRPLATIGRYIEARDAAAQHGTDLPYWQFYLLSFNPGPMWFVGVLLVFSALYVAWRRLADEGRDESGPATGQAPGAVAIAAFVIGLALVTYLWRIAVPMDFRLPGLPTPAYLPQYAALFVVGLIATRRGWPAGLSGTAGRAGFATAAVAAVSIVLLLASAGDAVLGQGTWPSLVMALCEQALAVGLILGLLVLFRERLAHQGRGRRNLSAHAYTVYVTHPLVLVALGYALSDVQAPAVVKFALLAVLGVPLCWVMALGVRALPGASKVL
ncbi:acyltransferase family protein [Pseudonocardia xinjiangensis]|uniref:acyltransferase family protein n=1 Tax=Pseudonocardia xinjiangensis TaxID=75289 RepID=UPI003D8C5228